MYNKWHLVVISHILSENLLGSFSPGVFWDIVTVVQHRHRKTRSSRKAARTLISQRKGADLFPPKSGIAHSIRCYQILRRGSYSSKILTIWKKQRSTKFYMQYLFFRHRNGLFSLHSSLDLETTEKNVLKKK